MKITITLAILCVIGTIFSLPSFVPVLIYHQPYRIITSVFAHSGYTHLFYNIFGLLIFGFILEKILGLKWYTLLIFISIGFSEIGYMILSNPFIGAIGISGVVYGLIGALATLKPKMIVYTPFGPLPMIVAAILWAVIEITALGSSDMIAHSAHLFGLIGGISFSLIYKFERKLTPLLLFSFLFIFFFYPFLPKIPVYKVQCSPVQIFKSETYSFASYRCKNETLTGIYLPNYKLSIDKQISQARKILSNFGNFVPEKIINYDETIYLYGKLNESEVKVKIKNEKYLSFYLIEVPVAQSG